MGNATWMRNGAEIRAIRTRLGLTQAAMARLVGVAPNTIARYERGEMGMGKPVMLLARLLEQRADNV